MGKKKQLQGAVVEIDIPVDVPQPLAEPQPKKKKEISEAQRANLAKGMAALKAKRDARTKKEVAEEEAPPPVSVPAPAPAPVAPVAPVAPEVKRERKPRVAKNYLTTEDFNSFRNELLTSFKKPEIQTPSFVAPVRDIPPIIVQPLIKERLISGRELLDKIFFN
jgi:hypothetical protein